MNELQVELDRQLSRFLEKNMEPHLEKDEANCHFRMETYQGLGELGVTGIPVSSDFGGAELGYLDLCYVLKNIAKTNVSYSVTLSVSTMVQGILEDFGTKDQKEKFLPKLTSGEGIGAFALTEAGAGSDAANLQTSATKKDGGYVLNGNKMFITSGGIAETYIVMARTGKEGAKGISAFIVPKDAKGLQFGKSEDKMGWKISPTRELIFDKCFVPEENLLGAEGEGFKIALRALDRGRITIGSIALGVSERALEEAIHFSMERKQFSQSLMDFQGLQFMFSDMATEFAASELLVLEAAKRFDSGNIDTMLASMAKLKATDVAMKLTTDCLQIFGGVGYTTEYPMERLMRDAKVLQIVEGTNQIQKVVIARLLKKKYRS
jgi:butyryl-CoA dehydrogenase